MRLLPLVAALTWAPRAGAGPLRTRPPPRGAAAVAPAGRQGRTVEDLSESVDALERAIGAAKRQAHGQRRASLAQLRAPHANRTFPDEAERDVLGFLKEDLEGSDLLSRARDLVARARHAIKLVQRIDGLEAELARATRELETEETSDGELMEERAREVQELQTEVSTWHGALARFRAPGPRLPAAAGAGQSTLVGGGNGSAAAGGAAGPSGGSRGAAARGATAPSEPLDGDTLRQADEDEDRKEVVIDGYPQFPGCYYRLNSGCKNHFKKTHLWRHDVWAEGGNVTASQCALRRHYWNEYCGVTDAKTAYVARPDEVEKSGSQLDSEEKASWTIDGYPKHHGCFMRLPSGCPSHFKKSRLWRHDVAAEGENATKSECLARKRYWDEYCNVTDAKMVHIDVPGAGAAADLAAAPPAGHRSLATLGQARRAAARPPHHSQADAQTAPPLHRAEAAPRRATARPPHHAQAATPLRRGASAPRRAPAGTALGPTA